MPHDLTSRFDVEQPHEPEQLRAIVEERQAGGRGAARATDETGTSMWCGLDLDAARPHLLRVAADVLTGQQLRVFLAWLNGQSVTDIAKDLGITHQVVSKHLHGQTAQGSDGKLWGGAMKKLRAHLVTDDAFVEELARSRGENDLPTGYAVIKDWYKGLRRNTLHHWLPRSVLLVLAHIADQKKTTTFAAAHECMPPAMLAEALPTLKALRYVETDGVMIRILKTPLDEEETR
jgi:DNA-binding CsgD family transcriptional regulator